MRRTLTRKNAEILDLSLKYKKELADLENQLNHTKMENDGLKGLSNDLKAEADVLKAELVFLLSLFSRLIRTNFKNLNRN